MLSLITRVRFLVPLAVLVCLDACLKVSAVLLLEPDQVLGASPNLQLMLRINTRGMGSWGQAAFSGASSSFLWKSILSLVAVTITLVLIRKLRRGILFVVLACLGASFAGSLLAELIFLFLGTPSDSLIVPCMRFAQSALWITVWYLTQSRTWKLGFLLLAAGAAGNFLSLIYPPYAIVDYLFAAPLYRLSGMGVINLADAMYLAAMPTLALAAAQLLWSRLFARNNDRKIDAEPDTLEEESDDDQPPTTVV